MLTAVEFIRTELGRLHRARLVDRLADGTVLDVGRDQGLELGLLLTDHAQLVRVRGDLGPTEAGDEVVILLNDTVELIDGQAAHGPLGRGCAARAGAPRDLGV